MEGTKSEEKGFEDYSRSVDLYSRDHTLRVVRPIPNPPQLIHLRRKALSHQLPPHARRRGRGAGRTYRPPAPANVNLIHHRHYPLSHGRLLGIKSVSHILAGRAAAPRRLCTSSAKSSGVDSKPAVKAGLKKPVLCPSHYQQRLILSFSNLLCQGLYHLAAVIIIQPPVGGLSDTSD